MKKKFDKIKKDVTKKVKDIESIEDLKKLPED
jgi:hypothetical protein